MQGAWYFKPLFSKALNDSIKWSLSFNALLSWSLNYLRNEKTVVGIIAVRLVQGLRWISTEQSYIPLYSPTENTLLPSISNSKHIYFPLLGLPLPGWVPTLCNPKQGRASQGHRRLPGSTALCHCLSLLLSFGLFGFSFGLASNSSPPGWKACLRVARLNKYPVVGWMSFM